MPIVNMKDMLLHAYENKYAVGAFDVVNIDFIQGVMDAAERTQSPVIISLAESHFEYFDFSMLMAAVETAAKRASVPVAIHLDHGGSFESAVEAIRLGCNGVMVDASEKPLQENIRITQSLVAMARDCGIPVEGELGYVPGVEGEDAQRHPGEILYTTVEEARTYVQETGVDFLAVSIGTVHGRMQGKPKLDFLRLQDINATLKIPLVIHGGTGLDDAQFQTLIGNGVAKINYYTALSDIAASQVTKNCSTSQTISFTSQVKNIPNAISEEVERCMRLWGSADRAAEVLAYCQPWLPVEHLIIYNVEGLHNDGVKKMAVEGKSILSKIPGVREVFIGESMQKDDNYRYTWLVRFCHRAVIDSYREHPDHVAFANNLFRPIAGNRISIDYLEMN
jgi:fructose-bisphosphate aldolase, class II